jgi:tyrosine-protein kinase Etk/Wzc
LWQSLFYSGRTTGKTVLVCAARPGDSASVTACGLAAAGSQLGAGIRIALADLDLRRPRVHRLLHTAHVPGVTEVVTGGLRAANAVKHVRPGLDVYPSGHVADRADSILHSDRLAGLLSELSLKYDHVLVSAASAAAHGDVEILAGLVRDVLLVAAPGRGARKESVRARKRIEAAGGRVAGVATYGNAPAEL